METRALLRWLRYAPAMAAVLVSAARADEFPDGAADISAADIAQRVSGKVLNVKLKDGSTWRIEYKSNGYYFFNASSGFADSGQWKVEDGKLCHNGRKRGPSCNTVKLHDGAMLLKRDNSDVLMWGEKS